MLAEIVKKWADEQRDPAYCHVAGPDTMGLYEFDGSVDVLELARRVAESCAKLVDETNAERSRHARVLLDRAAAKIREVSKDSLT